MGRGRERTPRARSSGKTLARRCGAVVGSGGNVKTVVEDGRKKEYSDGPEIRQMFIEWWKFVARKEADFQTQWTIIVSPTYFSFY
jgi:hypothetical protein